MNTFWVDLIAYGAVALISLGLVPVVLGIGIRRRVNLLFIALMLAIALWAGTSVVLRISLWRVWQAGPLQQFWMELSSLAFLLMAPLILAFSAAYVETKARWPYWVSLLGLVGIGLFAFPLFRHQVVYNVHLTPSGVVSWDRTPLGFVLSLPQAVGPILSLVLLWQERRRIRDYSLMAALALLLASALIFSIIPVNFPSLSLTTLLVVGLLAYAILNRQLFSPLRELTRELEKRVEERTRELAETSLRLQEANRDLARRTAQLEAASEVARRAAEIRDVQALLDETVRLISQRFGFYHAGVFLVDEAREYAVLRAASSEGGQRMLARGHRLAVGEVGIVGYVAGTGKPRIALDVGEDAVFFINPDLPHTRSEMALPLKVGERVIGVLDVQSVDPSAFTDEDVSVLQTLADQIALAIENARLLQETQDRLREVEALTGQAVRAGWQQMASARPTWGYVYDGVEVRPKEQASLPEETAPGLMMPLQLATGETVGQVALAFSDRSPTDEEVALARAVAEQAALALESARLFQETRHTLAEMEALYQASRAISTASTPDEVLHAFVDHVIPPQIGRCVLALIDPESLPEEPVVEVVAAWDRGLERSPSLGRRWSTAQIPFIARRATEPVIIADVDAYPDADEISRYVFRHVLGVRAVLSIPLMIGQRLLGWLMVESLSEPCEFSEREVRLYRTLADQAALALERMRLFEETRRRAEWERIRAEVSARVRASTDMETILRTAVRELGRAFRAAEGVIQLHGGDGHG
jgi:GAF domain-containing protein